MQKSEGMEGVGGGVRQRHNTPLDSGSAADSSMKHGQMSPTNFPTTPDKTMSHIGTPEPSVSNSSIKHSKRESYKAQKRTYRSQKKEAAKELLSTITDPAVVLLGDWLKVRGTLKSWTKLWCVLKPGVLILYKSDKHKGSQWVGTILLNTCQLLERPSKKDGFCFKLFHPLDQSIWATKGPKGEQIGAFVQPLPYSYCIFRAPSESAGKCWMDALELALKCTNLLKRSMTRLDNTADTAADLDLIERSRNQDAPWRPPSQGEDEHVSHNGSDHLHDVEGEVFSHSFNSMRAQERSMNESDLERHFANQGPLTCRAVEKAAAKERDSELQSAKSVESADGAQPARERNIDRRSRYSPLPRRSDTSQSPPPFIVSKTILRSPAIVKPLYTRAKSAPLPKKCSLSDSAFSQASQQTEDSKRFVDQDTELWIQPHSDSQAEQDSKGSTVTPSGMPPSKQPPFVYRVSGEVEDISLSDSTVASKLRVKPLGPLDVAGSKGPPGAAGLKGPDGRPAQWLVKGADIVWTDDGCVQICEASHTSVDSGGRDPASAWLLVVSGHHTPTDTERTSSGSQPRSLHPLLDTTSRDSSNRSAQVGYDGDVSGINSATYSGASGQPPGLGREREDRAAGATMWEVSWDGAQSPSASSSSRKVGSRVRLEYHKQCVREGRVVSPRTVRSSSPTSTRTSPRSSPTKWDAETEPGEVTASARSRVATLVDKAWCPPGGVPSPSARSRVETDVDRGRPIGSILSPSARSRFGWKRSLTEDGTASSEASSSHITSVSSLPRSKANADRGSDSSLHTHTDSGPMQGVNFGVSRHTPTRRGDKHLTFEGTDQEFERGSFTSEWPTDTETLIGHTAPLPSILKIRFSEDTATEDTATEETDTQASSSARLTVIDTHTTSASENTGSGMRSSKTSLWETETETPTGSSSRKPTASDTQSEQTTEVSTPTGSSNKRQTGSETTSTETGTPTGSTNKRQTGSETQSSLTSTWGTHTDTALSTAGKSVETQNSQQSRDTLSPADRPGSTSDSLTSTDARTDPSSASSAYEVRSRASIANSANQARSRMSSASSASEVRSQASSASSANEAKSRASNASSANKAKSRASSASSANEVRFPASTASSTKEAKSRVSSASSADEVRSQASSASSANEVRFPASTASSTKKAKSRAFSASSANKLRSQASKVKSAEVRSQASKVKSANEVRSQASKVKSANEVRSQASSKSSTSSISGDSSEDSSDSSLPVSKVSNDSSLPVSKVSNNSSLPVSKVSNNSSLPMSKVSNDSSLPMSKVSDALDHNVSAKGSWSNTPAHSALDHNVSAKGSWSNTLAHSALDHNVSARGSWTSLSMSASPSRSRISTGTSNDTSLSSGRLYRQAPGSSHRNKKEGDGKGGHKKKKDKGEDGGEKKKKKKDKDGEKGEEGAAEGEGGDKKKKKEKKKKDKEGFLDEPPAEGAGEDNDKKKKKSKKKKDKDGGEGKEGEAAPAAGEGAEGGEAGEEGGKKKKKKKDKKKGEEGADPAASGGEAAPGAEGGEDDKKKKKKKDKKEDKEGEKPEGEKSGDAAAEGGDDKKKKKSKKKKKDKEEGGEEPKAEGAAPEGDAAGDEGGKKKKKKKKKGKDEEGATSGDDQPTTSQGEATDIPQVEVTPPSPVKPENPSMGEAKPEEPSGDGQGVNIEALSGAAVTGQASDVDVMPSSSGAEMSDPAQAGESAAPASGKSDFRSDLSRKTSTSENEDHVFDLPYGYDKEATWKDKGQAPKLNKVCSKCVVALKREDPYGCLFLPDNQDTAETQRYKVMPVSDLRAEGASMTVSRRPRPPVEELEYALLALKIRKVRLESQKMELEKENLRMDILVKEEHLHQEFGKDTWRGLLPPMPGEVTMTVCPQGCQGRCKNTFSCGKDGGCNISQNWRQDSKLALPSVHVQTVKTQVCLEGRENPPGRLDTSGRGRGERDGDRRKEDRLAESKDTKRDKAHSEASASSHRHWAGAGLRTPLEKDRGGAVSWHSASLSDPWGQLWENKDAPLQSDLGSRQDNQESNKNVRVESKRDGRKFKVKKSWSFSFRGIKFGHK